MKRCVKYGLLASLLPLVACSKNSIEDEDSCLDPSYQVPLEVVVNVDQQFNEFKTIDSIFYNTRSSTDEPYLKYYVAAYPMTSGLPTVIGTSFESKVPLKIHPGRYSMVGWVMYESPDDSRSHNFYDDDFGELLLRNKYNYSGADISKLAFRGEDPKNIAYNTPSVKLETKPAMGYYKLVATDTADFKPDKVMIYYTSLLPAAIHARTGKINWWWSDINFPSKVKSLENGDLLGADYVLSQDNAQTSVTVTVEIYDETGKVRARKKDVEIPLVNGGITTVKGNFYSILDLDGDGNAGSGISIKTEWDATFEIEL